jgi:hypothetical protein
VRLLTGATSVAAITSFFRKPVLVGSSFSAVAPYVNALAYPPTGAAEAVGNEELKLAYAAGTVSWSLVLE